MTYRDNYAQVAASFQRRAAAYYHSARFWLDRDPEVAVFMQRAAAFDSLRARRLMRIEE